MPTRKQKIFAIYRYIKECQPYIYYNLGGAKECFRVAKILVDVFGLPKGDARDCEIVVRYSRIYIERMMLECYANLERRYVKHGTSEIF